MITRRSSKRKQDQQLISPVDDNTLEALVPDYGDVGFRHFLRSSRFQKSMFSRSQEDETHTKRPLKLIKV